MACLCFLCTSISDTILLVCLSAAICHTAKQTNKKVMEYWLQGSTSTAILPTSTSDIVGQCNKIRGISFGAALSVC